MFTQTNPGRRTDDVYVYTYCGALDLGPPSMRELHWCTALHSEIIEIIARSGPACYCSCAVGLEVPCQHSGKYWLLGSRCRGGITGVWVAEDFFLVLTLWGWEDLFGMLRIRLECKMYTSETRWNGYYVASLKISQKYTYVMIDH